MGQAANPYQQLWRVVDGAVTDCFKNHPNYLSRSGRKYAQGSLVKRVTGTVLSFAAQAARGREAAAETEQATPMSAPEAVGVHASTATLSAKTRPSAWVRPGYSRYHKSGPFASKCAELQRAVEVDRLCVNAVSQAIAATVLPSKKVRTTIELMKATAR